VIVGRRYLCDSCDRWHVSTATGFFLTEDGACVTNRHVLKGKPDTTFAVMTTDGEVHPVREVLAADEENDVAILDVEGDGFSPLPLRRSVDVGAPIWILSHPASTYYFFSDGIVARRFVRTAPGRQLVELLDVTADFARGSSGAPVLDETGAVVGVVRSTRSIYYEEHGGVQKNLQMVQRICTPAAALAELVEPDPGSRR
jgi:S1-C subfamily serine protease